MQLAVLETHSNRFDADLASRGEQHLVFTNPGTLEIALVKLLGVSVKETSDPIGFFGTGLKYAMAAVMRLGGRMAIITGGQTYKVGGKPIRLRDRDFTQVTLNDEDLGFTTELGKQWEPWMVVRELYSNALDESGTTSLSTSDNAAPSASDTVIVLYGKDFVRVWQERSRYFIDLSERVPMITGKHADVYPNGNGTVFYRGIRIHETVIPTFYRYNLNEKVTLTEDRTLKYSFTFDQVLEKTIITSHNREFIRCALTTGETLYEGRLSFDNSFFDVEMSSEFREVCACLQERMPANVNKAALRWYQNQTNTKQPLQSATLTRVQQLQLDKATAFMARLGCDYLHLYPIQVVKWLGEGRHGQAKDATIYLSLECFDRGTKYLTSTLYEEYVHLHYGLSDCSRNLQTWLFDKVVTMAEELHGEPL